MISASSLLRSLLVYGLCLPLAAFLGYLLATPLDLTTFATVAVVLFILLVPVLLRWHHVWLIASWNASAVIFFLPGPPPLWLGMAGISLLIAFMQYAVNRDRKFLSVPSLNWPLLFLIVVVVVTARLTGGFGMRAFGSGIYGGKRYFLLLGALAGYFALASRPIPPPRAKLYITLFFLGYGTMAIGNLAGMLSSSFNFLFFFFPVESLQGLSPTDVTGKTGLIWRSGGMATLGLGVCCALLARHSLRDLFDVSKPLRWLAFFGFVMLGLFGGFRSFLAQVLLLLAALFWLEGLYRSRALPVAAGVVLVAATFLVGFATHLPLPIQRTLAFLPVEIDPSVRMDAQYSSEWRLRMWQDILPEIPRHLILGKGYLMNPNEMDIARLTSRTQGGTQESELAGDYHSGPLTVIIAFGAFGAIGFLWFMAAATRVLVRNYKFGNPAFGRINTFLLAFFLAKAVFFLAIFGSFSLEMAIFTGIVGLSVSLNGGVARPQFVESQPDIALSRFRLSPAARKPVGI